MTRIRIAFTVIILSLCVFINTSCTTKLISDDDSWLFGVYGYRISPGNYVCNGYLCQCGISFPNEESGYEDMVSFLHGLPIIKKELPPDIGLVSLYFWRGSENWYVYESGYVLYEKNFLNIKEYGEKKSLNYFISKDNVRIMMGKMESRASGLDITCKKGEIIYPYGIRLEE